VPVPGKQSTVDQILLPSAPNTVNVCKEPDTSRWQACFPVFVTVSSRRGCSPTTKLGADGAAVREISASAHSSLPCASYDGGAGAGSGAGAGAGAAGVAAGAGSGAAGEEGAAADTAGAAGTAAAAGTETAGTEADAAGLAADAGEPAAGEPVADPDGETDPDAADDLVGTGEMAVDAASSPVRVGAAAEVATFPAASETAEDREDRVARNHTMPISTATASTTAETLRTQ